MHTYTAGMCSPVNVVGTSSIGITDSFGPGMVAPPAVFFGRTNFFVGIAEKIKRKTIIDYSKNKSNDEETQYLDPRTRKFIKSLERERPPKGTPNQEPLDQQTQPISDPASLSLSSGIAKRRADNSLH
jgi:hypothetical protein